MEREERRKSRNWESRKLKLGRQDDGTTGLRTTGPETQKLGKRKEENADPMKQDVRQKNGGRKIFHFLSSFCPHLFASTPLRSLRLDKFFHRFNDLTDLTYLTSSTPCPSVVNSLRSLRSLRLNPFVRQFSLSRWQSLLSPASFFGCFRRLLVPYFEFKLAFISIDSPFNSAFHPRVTLKTGLWPAPVFY